MHPEGTPQQYRDDGQRLRGVEEPQAQPERPLRPGAGLELVGLEVSPQVVAVQGTKYHERDHLEREPCEGEVDALAIFPRGDGR